MYQILEATTKNGAFFFMEINLDEILTPDEKARFIKNWFRRKCRSEYRRRMFAKSAWLIKKLCKTAPSNPPLLAQCGAPAFRCRGDVLDSSLLPRRVGAVLENEFTGHKAMPARDTEIKGRIDLPPSVDGDDTPDGYHHLPGEQPGRERHPRTLLEVSRDGNPILQKEIGPNLDVKGYLTPLNKIEDLRETDINKKSPAC